MAWCLVSSAGNSHYLQPSMMFIGREDCEIILQSHTIDKRHAVINFDQFDNIYTLKDVGSLNGTFVNESRIPEQTYVTLQSGDTIRFGYDPHVYRFEKAGRIDFTDLNPVNDNNMDQVAYEVDIRGMKSESRVKERVSMKTSDRAKISPQSSVERAAIKPTQRSKISPQNSFERESMKPTLRSKISPQNSFERESMKPSQRSKISPQNSVESLVEEGSSSQRRRHIKKLVAHGYHGSPLYGQPAWWGQEDENDDVTPVKHEIRRGRSGTFTKDDPYAPEVAAQKPLNGHESSDVERPSTLNLNEDKIYQRPSSDLKPQMPKQDDQDESQLNILAKSQKHASFTIEFAEKDTSAPKLGLQDSLSKYVPSKVREKIDENGRIMEEKKILRKIEEHLDMRPERLHGSGRNSAGAKYERGEKYRQKKLHATDMLSADSSYSDIDMPNVLMESDELVDNMFTENRLSRPKSSTGTVLEHVQTEESVDILQSRNYKATSLSRSKSMPSTKSRPTTRRKMPSHPLVKELAENGEDSDNLSETGTYTIEGEKKSKEEEEARKKIDAVFGIKQEDKNESDKNVVLESQMETESPEVIPQSPSPAASPGWVKQWSAVNGKEIQVTEKSRRHSEGARRKSDDDRSPPSKDAHKPLQRRKSRGRMLPQTPSLSRDSPAVSLRSMTPSDYSQYSNLSDREDLSVVSDIVSPTTATGHTKPRLPSDIVSPTTATGHTRLASDIVSPITRTGYTKHRQAIDTESLDTNILLQDTETVMEALESKLLRHHDECPSLDASFAESSYDDYSRASSEMDIESDLDTASNVSLVEGEPCVNRPKTPRSVKLRESFNAQKLAKQNSRTDYSSRTNKKSTTTSRRSENTRKASDSSSNAVWNRLSKPNRHKMKDGSVVSDCLSDSTKTDDKSVNQRNGSEPLVPKKSRTSPTIQPRPTRTTALRKSRFGDSGSGNESTDKSFRSSTSSLSTRDKRDNLNRSQSTKERNHKGPPRTTHRTKLGETDWKSETSLGGVIVKKAMESRASSSQNLANSRTPSVDKLRFGSGPSAFKPVVSNTKQERTNFSRKGGSSWRRYESTDGCSVSDSESTQTIQYNRQSNSLSEPEDNYQQSSKVKTGFEGKHAAEIAKISSTLADDLSKMAEGASDPQDVAAKKKKVPTATLR